MMPERKAFNGLSKGQNRRDLGLLPQHIRHGDMFVGYGVNALTAFMSLCNGADLLNRQISGINNPDIAILHDCKRGG